MDIHTNIQGDHLEKGRIIAMAALAVLIAGALVCVYSDDQSDAASEKSYQIYVEVIDSSGKVTDTQRVYFSAEPNNEAFVAAANAAFKEVSMPIELSITDNGITVDYNGSLNNACYYSDGSDWVAISDAATEYAKNNKIALAVNNGYISTATYNALSDRIAWQKSEYGDPYAYMKVPAALAKIGVLTDFKIFVDLIGSDYKLFEDGAVAFKSENVPDSFVDAANEAFAASSFPLTEFSYTGGWISVYYGLSFDNAAYMYDKGWKLISDTGVDYVSGKTLGLALEYGWIESSVYDKLPEDQKKNWQSSSMGPGYYAWIMSSDPTDQKTYTIDLEVINDELVSTGTKTVSFKSTDIVDDFILSANAAFAAAGYPEVTLTKGPRYISVAYDDSTNSATFRSVNGEWTVVKNTITEYVSGDRLAFVVNHGYISTQEYNGLSSSEQKHWTESGMSVGYEYIRDMSSDKSASGGMNLVLVAGAAIVIIVALGAVAFFYTRKKSA